MIMICTPILEETQQEYKKRTKKEKKRMINSLRPVDTQAGKQCFVKNSHVSLRAKETNRK